MRTQFRIETDDPNAKKSITLQADPQRPKLRRDSDEPKFTALRAETPKFLSNPRLKVLVPLPMESPAPILTRLLTLTEDPRERKSNTEMLEPDRANDRKLKLEAK
jgi:hypothetical protein